MIKDTFYNLPDRKQNRIIDVSFKEFVAYGFDLASIQRIVKNAGISRGSFYQYFDDKADLFEFVLMQAAQRKLKYLEPALVEKNNLGIFYFLDIVIKKAMNYLRDYPEDIKLAQAMWSSRTIDKKIEKKILHTIEQLGDFSSTDFYIKPIMNSINKKEIVSSLCPKLIATYIHSMFDGLAKYIFQKDVSKKLIDEEQIYEQFMKIIKNGLSVSGQSIKKRERK